jgi:hypothetical protein
MPRQVDVRFYGVVSVRIDPCGLIEIDTGHVVCRVAGYGDDLKLTSGH